VTDRPLIAYCATKPYLVSIPHHGSFTGNHVARNPNDPVWNLSERVSAGALGGYIGLLNPRYVHIVIVETERLMTSGATRANTQALDDDNSANNDSLIVDRPNNSYAIGIDRLTSYVTENSARRRPTTLSLKIMK